MLNEIVLMLIGALGGLSMGIIGVGAGILTIPLLILFGPKFKNSHRLCFNYVFSGPDPCRYFI